MLIAAEHSTTVSAPPADREVVLGVDTHSQSHHAALLDSNGVLVDDRSFDATTAG